MKTARLPALAVTLFLLALPAGAQDSTPLGAAEPEWETRTVSFDLGARATDFEVEVEYQDPSGVDLRLRDAAVLPVHVSIRNVSGRPLPFSTGDIVLNLNGTEPLDAVDDDVVVQQIEAMRKTGRNSPLLRRLLSVLVAQSTAFHPGIHQQIRARLRSLRFRDGTLRPGERRKGVIFFMPSAATDPAPFNGVMWLEFRGTSGYAAELLETKSVRVKRKVTEQSSFRARLERLWDEIVHGVKPPFNKSYALLIGIGKYQHLEQLTSPAQDVAKMEAFLDSQGFNEIVTVEDETVTPQMLRSPQKYFANKIQSDDRFLFYYSGHGVSREEGGRQRGYLPLVPETSGGTHQSIAMDSLVSWMQGLSARHLLVILDSCFSGLAVQGPDVNDNNTRGRKMDAEVLTQLAGAGRFLLMAGTTGQQSFGNARWNGSLFTDSLIRGLRKDADLQRDKIVTTRELYVWLRDAVSAEAMKVSRTLTPLLKDLGPNGTSVGEFFFVQ